MKCPICNCKKINKIAISTREEGGGKKAGLLECQNCQVIFSEDYQQDRSYIYGENYAAWGASIDDKKEKKISIAKKMACESQIKSIKKYLKGSEIRILDIGAGNGYLMECASELGFDAWGTEISSHSADICEKKFPGKIHLGTISGAGYQDRFFDVVFLTDVLEHLPDPLQSMKEIKRILKPGGYLLIISPNSGSATRKILGKNWFQYKHEHVLYYNRRSLKYLLDLFNLSLLDFKNNHKKFTLAYYYFYFEKYSFLGIGKIWRSLYPYMPEFIRNLSFSNPITGEFSAIARKKT
jgi:2-polyprenyl-3-methyl-5-hydroxy-6-metoxy-1,4-benzoquinol methylase